LNLPTVSEEGLIFFPNSDTLEAVSANAFPNFWIFSPAFNLFNLNPFMLNFFFVFTSSLSPCPSEVSCSESSFVSSSTSGFKVSTINDGASFFFWFTNVINALSPFRLTPIFVISLAIFFCSDATMISAKFSERMPCVDRRSASFSSSKTPAVLASFFFIISAIFTAFPPLITYISPFPIEPIYRPSFLTKHTSIVKSILLPSISLSDWIKLLNLLKPSSKEDFIDSFVVFSWE